MQYLNTMYFKTIVLTFLSMVMCSFKASADLPLPMFNGDNSALPETREFLLTGDGILLIGFLLWIAYVVFCFPRNTFKKL